MGRHRRHDPPGSLHFITNRGTAQTAIFRSDRDRRMFLWLLGELERRFGVRVLGYVLMGNHYHLILQSVDGRLAEAMHFLDGNYARWFNATHGRSGALFQGRYDDRLIQNEQHRDRVGIYLHLNPAKANLVSRAIDFPWSSLAALAAGRSAVSWLSLDLLAGRTGAEYLALVDSELEAVGSVNGGDDDAVHQWCIAWSVSVEAAFAASDVLVADVFGTSIDDLYVVARGRTNVPRMAAIVRAARTLGRPLDEVALRYGLRTAAGVQSATRRLRAISEREPSVAHRLEQLDLNHRIERRAS